MSNLISTCQGAGVPEQESDTSFPLMKLPIEFRVQVYRKLLLSKHALRMKDGSFPGATRLHIDILRTSRQVYDEAAEVLYTENEFCINHIDEDNPNASRVKRAKTNIPRTVRQFDWIPYMVALSCFMRDHPNLTYLCLDFGGNVVEQETVHISVEKALQRHNGLTDLEIHVENTLSRKSINFCWRLDSIVRGNRATSRPEEAELHDTTTCPPFVKVRSPWSRRTRRDRQLEGEREFVSTLLR
jgi:hypothetical protein